MFNMGGQPTTTKLVLELANLALESADFIADSNADPLQIDVWVWVLRLIA